MATLKNTTINDTGFLQLPAGTYLERPASPAVGSTRWNTSFKVWETWNGSAWEGGPAVLSSYTGNSIAYAYGTYQILGWTGSGSITVSSGGEIEIFAIGGGGGGGGTQNASVPGGDSGQVIQGVFLVPAGTYAITIGAGGNYSAGWGYAAATNGTATSLGSFLSAAGGAASANYYCCPSQQQYQTTNFGEGRSSAGIVASGNGDYRAGMYTFIAPSDAAQSDWYGGAYGSYYLDTSPPAAQAANSGNGGWGVWSNANRRGGAGGSGKLIIRYRVN